MITRTEYVKAREVVKKTVRFDRKGEAGLAVMSQYVTQAEDAASINNDIANAYNDLYEGIVDILINNELDYTKLEQIAGLIKKDNEDEVDSSGAPDSTEPASTDQPALDL